MKTALTVTPWLSGLVISKVTPSASPAGFSVLELTSPVLPDGIATVTIQTAPGIECLLEYTKPGGTESHAVGLGEQIADANGICSWTWKLSMGRKLPASGTGRLTITANGVWQIFGIVLK